ncbi:MAG: glycosyltransferase family 39 protein [Chthoniobacterales bacterium]|nr:glycosyltransferase family 39 protein [Chthoniobacterales bacterium]
MHSKIKRIFWNKPVPVLFAGTVLLLMSLGITQLTAPKYSASKWTQPDGNTKIVAFPFFQDDAQIGTHRLETIIELSAFFPTTFTAYVDDWVQELLVNGQNVVPKGYPIVYDTPKTLDLSGCLHAGKNTISVKIENAFAGVRFFWQPAFSGSWGFILLGMALAGFGLLFRWALLIFPALLGYEEALILWIATGLRLLYVLGTPYFLRTYDLGGHLSYIKFVAEHFRLPPHNLGWETFQPPLYYIVSAFCSWIALFFGSGSEGVMQSLQWESFGISLFTICATVWIARILYPPPDHRRLWLLGIVAVFPSIVYYSSRINNDVLFGLISFIWLGVLLVFWRHPSWKWLLRLAIATGLGLLTKSSALVFIPITLTMLCVMRFVPWKRKALIAAIFCGISLLIYSPYLLRRAAESKDPSSFVVGNLNGLADELKLTPKVSNILTFDPAEVIKQPFTWSSPDNPRRDYFWEYFFRSSFFGEWKQPDEYLVIARTIVVAAMLMLPFIVLGACSSLRKHDSYGWPLGICLGGFLGSQITWLVMEPFACGQDFRYFIAIIIPLGFFLLEGFQVAPKMLKALGYLVLGFLLANCALFLAMLICL